MELPVLLQSVSQALGLESLELELGPQGTTPPQATSWLSGILKKEDQ